MGRFVLDHNISNSSDVVRVGREVVLLSWVGSLQPGVPFPESLPENIPAFVACFNLDLAPRGVHQLITELYQISQAVPFRMLVQLVQE
jgi:hypothetical protein